MRRMLITAASLMLAACSVAAAQEWSRFRGPEGTGRTTGDFVDAAKAGQFAWRTPIEGIGHSSPVVWKDRIYLTSAGADDGRRFVDCFSAADGKPLWQHESKFISHRKHKDNSFASPTPAADDLGVYVIFTTPQEYSLIALDHDGLERWSKSLGRFASNHGGGSSPMVYKDLVIVSDDQEAPGSAVYAFDRKSGEQVWKTEHESSNKAAMMTPTVWHPAGGKEQIVIASFGAGIQGLDPETGKLIWTAADVFSSRPIGSPQTTDRIVIAVCGEGTNQRTLVAVQPDPTGKTEPKKLYELDKIGPHVPCPLIMGNKMLLLNDVGQLSCCELETGKTIWTEKTGGAFYGSPILTDNTLWAVSKTGDLYAWDVSGDGYNLISKTPLGAMSHATPAVADGKMFIRTVKELVCLNAKGQVAAR